VAPVENRPAGVVRDFLTGVGLFGRGFALYARKPGLILLGIVPALIAGLLYVGALVLLIAFLPHLAAGVTWFAHDWATGARDTIRLLAGVAIVGVFVLFGIVTFTALTLLIGDPFYEKISQQVEQWHGGVPDAVDVPWYRSLRRNVLDALRLVLVSALVSIPLFLAGFLPVVGQTVVPVLGAAVAGWFLAVELTGVPFERRGKGLRDRRRALGTHRAMTVGFGAAVFVSFLIPLGPVLLTPAAVAGATLLARRVLGQPVTEPPRPQLTSPGPR
jgi:CysZ protein